MSSVSSTIFFILRLGLVGGVGIAGTFFLLLDSFGVVLLLSLATLACESLPLEVTILLPALEVAAEAARILLMLASADPAAMLASFSFFFLTTKFYHS